MPRKKMITVSVQLDPELYNKFREKSEGEHRPMASQVRLFIERWVEETDRRKL